MKNSLINVPNLCGLPGTYHFAGQDLVSIGHFSPGLQATLVGVCGFDGVEVEEKTDNGQYPPGN